MSSNSSFYDGSSAERRLRGNEALLEDGTEAP